MEGLTESKVTELQWHMRRHEIDILCMQETHQEHSSLRITDGGFLLVLSGFATSEPVETAGVGFLISPSARRSVVSFQQHSARMAGLKL